MTTINILFKLKDINSTKPTPVNLIVYFNKIQFKYSTGERINPVFWNDYNLIEGKKNIIQRAYTKNDESGLSLKMSTETIRDNKRINFILDEYTAATKKYFEYLTFQRIQPTPEKLKELFDKDFRPELKPQKVKAKDFNTFIDQYINEIETGKRLTEKGTRFRPNTFKNFNSFKAKFDEYQQDKHKKIDFKNITIDFYTQFTGYFTEKGYKLNTIGRHIKTLKTLMKAAKDGGLHENTESERKQFKTFRVETDEVYLTETELQKIIDVDLTETPHFEKVRDVFLTGCYISQRYSDYSRLNETNIKTLEDGTRIIELFQQKTGQKVNIPIKPELNRILAKYGYNLPKTYEQKVNAGIKKICEKAEINDPVLVEIIKGGMIVKTTVPKHKLIKSHSARRTGATLMYLAGVPTIAAMKITGHKTEREYLRYIKVSIEENAQTLSLHPYFSGTMLKLVN